MINRKPNQTNGEIEIEIALLCLVVLLFVWMGTVQVIQRLAMFTTP